MNYHDYLKLDLLLSAQEPESTKRGKTAHDEMLFITVHHSYEVWFKQMLFEMDSVLGLFGKTKVDETEMGVVVHRLGRVVAIFKNLIDQVNILETMTPLDFLEFRNLLFPASGFQSLQFRLLENKIGLPADQRLPYNDQHYSTQLKPEQRPTADKSQKDLNLFEAVQAWLERTPFLNDKDFPFWSSYEKTVRESFSFDIKSIEENEFLKPEQKAKATEQMKNALLAFESLFSEEKFNESLKRGEWRLSFKAVRAALLIQLYRDLPAFQQAHRLLCLVQDVDSQLTQWRYRHAIMVQRMLGRKVGTGGSSGAAYLHSTAEKHRVFQDFYQLTSFYVPRSKLPDLPASARKAMGFSFEV